MKLFRTGLTAIALAASFGGAVQAAPVFASGGSSIFFNNYENLYRPIGNCNVAAPCLTAVAGDPVGYRRANHTVAGNVRTGDIFAGILNVQNVTSNVSGFDTYNSNPLTRFTGYFAQEVVSLVAPAAHVNPLTAHITLGTVAADPFGILGAGEMFRLYSDTPNFSSGLSAFNVTAGIAMATSGNFWASLGLGTEGYAYTHTDLTVTVTTSGTENFSALDFIAYGAAYSAGLVNKINGFNEDEIGGLIGSPGSQICSAAEIAAAGISCTDVTGTSEIEANSNFGITSPWQYASNDPFEINRMAVPEPGSLALIGLAIAGLGLTRRRRTV